MKGTKIQISLAILLFFVLVGTVIFQLFEKKLLMSSGQLVNVQIIEYLPPGKGMNNASYRCQFLWNGEYKKIVSSSTIEDNKRSYVGKFYPSLYFEKSGSFRVLITPEDLMSMVSNILIVY